MGKMTDEKLESEIQAAARALVDAPDRAAELAAWNRMQKLIRQRTPEAIARMEQEKFARVMNE